MHLDKRSQSAARRPFIEETTTVDPDVHASDCSCNDCLQRYNDPHGDTLQERSYFSPDADCICEYHDDPDHGTYCACCERL